jgi:hypothetical protein
MITTHEHTISFQGSTLSRILHCSPAVARVETQLGLWALSRWPHSIMASGPSMLPTKSPYFLPATIHCPLDHLRMHFDPSTRVYRCNLSSCNVAYAPSRGYYRVGERPTNTQTHESFYGQAAICLCENDDQHPLYIEDYVVARKVRFWACPVRSCGYEVSQRLEKTESGWRTCGSFEQSKPVKLRH